MVYTSTYITYFSIWRSYTILHQALVTPFLFYSALQSKIPIQYSQLHAHLMWLPYDISHASPYFVLWPIKSLTTTLTQKAAPMFGFFEKIHIVCNNYSGSTKCLNVL